MPLTSVTAWAVFALGVTSFVSPCVLPLVPVYMAWLAAGSGERARRFGAVIMGLLFVLGFTAVFVAMGATASGIGQLLRRYAAIVRYAGGILIILLGLFYAGALRLPLLMRERRIDAASRVSGWPKALRALAMGMALALGWTPCIGPALGAALTLAASANTAWRGAGLLLVYGIGMGLPFLLLSAFWDALGPLLKRVLPHLPLIQRLGGALLIIMGILQITGVIAIA